MKKGNLVDECINNKHGRMKSSDEAYISQEDGYSSNQMLLMVTTNSDTNNSESWYLDTGFSECSIEFKRKHVQEVLKRFQMEKYNEEATPVETNEESEKSTDATLFKQLMGSVLFLCNSRSNISYGVRQIN
ncbi:hypothetical protein GmHk_01G002361 [Glycine max]|nr:hypothetical protein GmHk_01G002361 [Glycine max]